MIKKENKPLPGLFLPDRRGIVSPLFDDHGEPEKLVRLRLVTMIVYTLRPPLMIRRHSYVEWKKIGSSMGTLHYPRKKSEGN